VGFNLAFALQLRKKHGKTSVRVIIIIIIIIIINFDTLKMHGTT